jgi:hypothetical protein
VRLAVSAQDFDPPLRLEFNMAENKSMNMELLGKNGLALFFQKDSKEETKWIVCHYDTNFQLMKMRSVPFEEKTVICATASDENFFYAILQSESAAKTTTANTYILCYNAVTKKIDVFSFYRAEKGKILSIARLGNIFVYSTYTSKSEEFVYVFNTQNLTHTVLYQDKAGSCELQEIYLDTVSQTLWVISKFYEAKKQTQVFLTQLDTNGTVLQEIPIASEGKYHLNSCKIVYSDSNNRLFLSGNYLDNEDTKRTTKNNNSGVFTAIVKDGQVGELLFFDYSMLENWYILNKRSLSSSYDILYFVAQNDSLVILASDFYTPEYHQYYADQYAGGIGIYTTTPLESKLIGFKYQTACIFTFDKEGKMLWYTPFNYSGLLLKSIRPLLSGCIDSETNDVLYLFGFGNKIFSLIYHQTEIVQSIKSIAIQSSSHFESINSSEKTQCQYWYGNNFIASAYQRTSKKYGSNSHKNSKYVFGINKLIYR